MNKSLFERGDLVAPIEKYKKAHADRGREYGVVIERGSGAGKPHYRVEWNNGNRTLVYAVNLVKLISASEN
jgi:hypothetical protein